LSFELTPSQEVVGSFIKAVGCGCPDLAGADPDGTLWMGDDPGFPELSVPIDSAPDGTFGATFKAPSKPQGDYLVHVTCGEASVAQWLYISHNPHGRVERWAGADRYRSAATFSARAFTPGVNTALIASGEDYPDALAGAPVAAMRRSPVLLTQRDVLPSATISELKRLKPKEIVILGGPAAVSALVASQLAPLTAGSVTRWSGADRYGTAAAVTTMGFEHKHDLTAFVASGQGFADALSGAAGQWPLLLTRPTTLPASSANVMESLGVQSARILGGSSAVSVQVAQQVAQLVPEGTKRFAGPDRYATSAAVSAGVQGSSEVTVFIASGQSFPDALAGAAIAGMVGSPVLLTRPDVLPTPIANEIKRLKPSKVIILGGTGAVSGAVETSLLLLVGGSP
jgi:putative cell wall-binding protein